jgi:hypothetical protein
MDGADEGCEDDGLACLPTILYNRAWDEAREGLHAVGRATMCIVYLKKRLRRKEMCTEALP